MRPVCPALLAAQRAYPQRPAVSAVVRDKQVRFTDRLPAPNAWDVRTDLCATWQEVAGVRQREWITIAAVDAAGIVRVRVVTDDATSAGWGMYPADFGQVAAGAKPPPYGDVAISCADGLIRIFYAKADGSQLLYVDSTDGGQTWGSAQACKSLGTAVTTVRLASGLPTALFYWRSTPGYRKVNYIRYLAGWGGDQVLDVTGGECPGELEQCFGLSVVYSAHLNRYAGVISTSGGDYSDPVMRSWQVAAGGAATHCQRIVPPGRAATGFFPWWPRLLEADLAAGRFFLCYTDRFGSTPGPKDPPGTETAWSVPVMIRSWDFDHWSFRIPLPFTTTCLQRLGPVHQSGRVHVYQAHECYRMRFYTAGDGSMETVIPQEDLLRYRIEERPDRGELVLELDNRDGAYDALGQWTAGGKGHALRPLAQVVMQQGLTLSGVATQVEHRPFYLWSTARVRSEGRNWLRLRCLDGWQILKMWRPEALYQFDGRTLRWCIEELAARVGNWTVGFDASVQWDEVLASVSVTGDASDWSGRHHLRALGRWVPLNAPALLIDPREDGYSVLQYLVGLVGGMVRFGNGAAQDELYCWIPANEGSPPAEVHTYTSTEVIVGEYVDGWVWPNVVRASGKFTAGGVVKSVGYQGWDSQGALAAGMEVFQLLYAGAWTTAAACQVAVDGALADANARGYGGYLEAAPNVGLELLDVVVFNDAHAGGTGLTAVRRRVNGIVTEFDPLGQDGAPWRQRLWLEGV